MIELEKTASVQADDWARLVRLRRTFADSGHGIAAGEAVPIPVLCSASVLFTDIRGFTRLTERFAHDPAALLDVLNAHLKKVVRSILICGGVVEKFMGDGVMATFGASGHQTDHIDRAMAAAIGLIGANESLNRRFAADWGFRLDVGVGIATGPVVVGAVGSSDRSELGILGDAVNVAARPCHSCRSRRGAHVGSRLRRCRGSAAERADDSIRAARPSRPPRDLPDVTAGRTRRPRLGTVYLQARLVGRGRRVRRLAMTSANETTTSRTAVECSASLVAPAAGCARCNIGSLHVVRCRRVFGTANLNWRKNPADHW